MKNIFLFFGAHDGSLINRLDTVTSNNVYGDNISWDEVHMFEPQPVHEQMLLELQSQDLRVRYHKLAVSTTNGIQSFYVKGDPSMGYCSSTLDGQKFSGQLYYTIDVNVINVVDWIHKHTNEDDFVCIDMDIECEEYNILPIIVESDILNRIKFISVEFHHGKSHKWSTNSYDKQVEKYIRERLGDKFLDHNTYYA